MWQPPSSNTWAKGLVLVMSFSFGDLTIILLPFSPSTLYATLINQVTPYNYPVLVGDDGSVPNSAQPPSGPKFGMAEETMSTSNDREDAPSPAVPSKNVKLKKNKQTNRMCPEPRKLR